jgi:hypothetical protein
VAAPDVAERLASFGSEVYRRLRPAQAHVLEVYSREHIGTADVAIELPTGEGKPAVSLLPATGEPAVGCGLAAGPRGRRCAEPASQQLRSCTMPKASCRSVPYKARLERFGVLKRFVQFSLTVTVCTLYVRYQTRIARILRRCIADQNSVRRSGGVDQIG